MTQLGLHALAVLVYPGGLFSLLVGGLGELATIRLLSQRGVPVVRTLRSRLLVSGRLAIEPVQAGAVLLALLAAAQVGIAFSPMPASERNLLTAAVALAAVTATLLALGWSRPGFEPRLLLLLQLAWLVSVFAPALATGSLRPQVFGAILGVPTVLPLKVVAGILYLICLPALLQLLPSAKGGRGTPRPYGLVRTLLWFPYCGLFATLFFPPGDDLASLFRQLGVTLGAGAIAIALAANLGPGGPRRVRRFGYWVVAPLAAVTACLGLLPGALQ